MLLLSEPDHRVISLLALMRDCASQLTATLAFAPVGAAVILRLHVPHEGMGIPAGAITHP